MTEATVVPPKEMKNNSAERRAADTLARGIWDGSLQVNEVIQLIARKYSKLYTQSIGKPYEPVSLEQRVRHVEDFASVLTMLSSDNEYLRGTIFDALAGNASLLNDGGERRFVIGPGDDGFVAVREVVDEPAKNSADSSTSKDPDDGVRNGGDS